MSDGDPEAITIEPAARVHGQLRVPGDKSISHRYALLAALAEGRSVIRNYAPGDDCASTLRCLASLGVTVRTGPREDDHTTTVIIEGRGLGRLAPPSGALDTGNSGTTMRLLTGILASHPFTTVMTGDDSLQRRPMRRVVDPLQEMGARVETTDGHAPLTIHGTPLTGISYSPPVASAQVKSAVLLAGLHAAGTTTITESVQTRDHTERALPAFGLAVQIRGSDVELAGGQHPTPASLRVPGDLSSAAFWAVAAAALPGSEIEILDVGLNPTRTAFLDVLRESGADVTTTLSEENGGEPVGVIRVCHRSVNPVTIGADRVPALIDELPILAVLGALGSGIEVSGASELRAKESDRIAVLARGLRALGGVVDETPDGFRVHPVTLTGGTVDAAGDHRMAMSFAVAALASGHTTTIHGHRAVDVSYPDFFGTLDSVCQRRGPR